MEVPAAGEPAADEPPASLQTRLLSAAASAESQPSESVALLHAIRDDVLRSSAVPLSRPARAISDSGCSVADLPTPSLPLLSLDYHIARCHLHGTSGAGPGGARRRLSDLDRARQFLRCFVENVVENLRAHEDAVDWDHCQGAGDKIVGKEVVEEYRRILAAEEEETDAGDGVFGGTSRMTAGVRRENKIARFRAKRAAESNRGRLRALLERRVRLGMDDGDEGDEEGDDPLTREANMMDLSFHVSDAVEEWGAILEERAMLMFAAKREEAGGDGDDAGAAAAHTDGRRRPAPGGPRPPTGPMKLTHLSQRPDGSIQMTREEIRNGVFRPSWNQPTMTLQELGDREVADALAREASQKESEALAMLAPRRYDRLVRDGMEDNADLVDASAVLDRDWDEFREANPRGSGNKMGERGDRNF